MARRVFASLGRTPWIVWPSNLRTPSKVYFNLRPHSMLDHDPLSKSRQH